MTFPPGTPIRVEMTKWGGGPHWQFDGVFLGTDDHGTWLGFPRGTEHARPGLAFASEVDSVTLLPTSGWWLATFHTKGIWCQVYVDIATEWAWDGNVVRSVDLDLDVIRRSDSQPGTPSVYVDDEDEFHEHQRALGYPAEVVHAAEQAAKAIHAAVRSGTAPFDEATSADWLALVPDLSG